MTPDQEVRRGKLALEVLQNPAYLDAYETLDAALVKTWRESKDARDREDLHKMLQLLSRLKTTMESAVRNGQITAKELERKKTFAERLINRSQ